MSNEKKMRGAIETRAAFVKRNLDWWRRNRQDRRPFYQKFLKAVNLPKRIKSKNWIIGEVGPGPYGGILGMYQWPAYEYYFIDYMMEELLTLNGCEWPHPSRFVTTPAEDMPLITNRLDVLISYNTLDHGWDVWKVLQECVRVSRRCYVSFDCRGDNPKHCRPGDIDHAQHIKFAEVQKFVGKTFNRHPVHEVFDLKSKEYPVAVVIVEKE